MGVAPIEGLHSIGQIAPRTARVRFSLARFRSGAVTVMETFKLSIDALRAHLGQDEFERSYARGRGLGFDDAIELALSGCRRASASSSNPAPEIASEPIDSR